MKVSDFGIKEVWNFKTIFLALFGIRIVRAVSFYHTFNIAVVGVPPWRPLESKDLYTKKCYEVK